MIERTITCDLCHENIPIDDNHIVVDGYWTKSHEDVPEMHFHPHCWDAVLSITRGKP